MAFKLKSQSEVFGLHEVASPIKQKKVDRSDGVQVKEVPKVVKEEVTQAVNFVGKKAKKALKFLGNINLTPSKEERKANKAKRKAKREAKKKAKEKKQI